MKQSLRSRFLLLEVGSQMVVRPKDGKLTLVRNYASSLGAEYRRRFTVNYDRAKNSCTVTRTA